MIGTSFDVREGARRLGYDKGPHWLRREPDPAKPEVPSGFVRLPSGNVVSAAVTSPAGAARPTVRTARLCAPGLASQQRPR